MIDSAPSFPEVIRGTPDDVDFILQWLKVEWDEGGGYLGFWGNRDIIRRAADETSDLWVIRKGGEAVAFQVGNYAADIVSVRADHQKSGLGTMLFQASVERALHDDITVLEGQCSPEASLPFWLRMGFEQYQDRQRPGDVRVRMVLHRTFELPTESQRVPVAISFYPEAAQYHGGQNTVPPIAVHEVQGALLEDGTVMLDRRVVGLEDDEPHGKDLAIKIEVGGQQRYFGKAKYEEAAATGVTRDWRGGAFFLDKIRPLGEG